MTYTIEVKELANKQVVDTFLYYESKLTGLGERFLKCWEQELEALQKAPYLNQKKYKNFRQVLLNPYPYHIIYEIEQQNIIVHKVPYARRHPRKRYSKK